MVLITTWLISCAREMPVQRDGVLTLTAIVADRSGVIGMNEKLGYAPVAGAKVTLESKKYYETATKPRTYVAFTDSDGVVVFNSLAAGTYAITAESQTLFTDPQTQITGLVTLRGAGIHNVFETVNIADTLKTTLAVQSTLAINEVYYGGAPPAKAYYFYDQFIELYNPGTDTVYLDGMLLCRGRNTLHTMMESNDFVQAIYVYKFPGTGRSGKQYPLPPDRFVVIAGDALDHSQYNSSALNMSAADWELFNPYGSDLDYPSANVLNALPEASSDFLMDLKHDVVILADSAAFYPGEMIESISRNYMHIPITYIIDAIEYSVNNDSKKRLTSRLDAGFGGIGLAKYSGKSIERRMPGFDTNNSSLDFVINNQPTPGYQH